MTFSSYPGYLSSLDDFYNVYSTGIASAFNNTPMRSRIYIRALEASSTRALPRSDRDVQFDLERDSVQAGRSAVPVGMAARASRVFFCNGPAVMVRALLAGAVAACRFRASLHSSDWWFSSCTHTLCPWFCGPRKLRLVCVCFLPRAVSFCRVFLPRPHRGLSHVLSAVQQRHLQQRVRRGARVRIHPKRAPQGERITSATVRVCFIHATLSRVVLVHRSPTRCGLWSRSQGSSWVVM
jgi:hypothetical protein